MDAPEIHPLHTGHGGVRWLEIAASLAALVVSFASIFIAVQHGKTMDKLVTANSIPYLDADRSNATEDGRKRLSVDLTNRGVGPAHEVSLKLKLHGRYLHSIDDMFVQVFGPEAAKAARQSTLVTTNSARTRFIPGRDRQFVYFVDRTPENAKVWDALNQAITGMTIETCYCSVFDECWTRLSGDDPRPVKQCVRDEPNEFMPAGGS